jgi:hypothetical protein
VADAEVRVLGQFSALAQVSERRNCSGSSLIAAVIASRAAFGAVGRSPGAPFLIFGMEDHPRAAGSAAS